MDLALYVVRQMEAVNANLQGIITGVSREEWCSAPGAGQNPLGFTAWHVPSIQDWAINTWMRNAETVRSRPEWAARGMMTSFLPIGMDLRAAFEIAKATSPEDVLLYSAAVLKEARSFLGTFAAERFEEIPPNKAHLADSRYDQQGYLEEISDMHEQPFWRVFAGACTGHCRGHLGEIELGLAILRSAQSTH